MKQRIYTAVLATLMVSGCASTSQKAEYVALQNRLDSIGEEIANLKKTQDETKGRQTELATIIMSLEAKVTDNSEKTAAVSARVQEMGERMERLAATPPSVVKPAKELSPAREQEESGKTLKTEAVSAEKLYQSAYENYDKGQFDEAVRQFSEFAVKYPKSSLADNAYYWIGEIYYSRKDYPRAILEFQRVVNEYPEENKAPDALYKMGLAYLEMRNVDKAKQEFRRLVNNFPYSEKAAMAKEKLSSLK